MVPENTAHFLLCQDHQEAPASSLQLEPSRESPWSRISLPSTLGFLRMKLKALSRNSTTSLSPEGGTWTPLTGKFEWGFWESTATSVLRKTASRGGGRLRDCCRLVTIFTLEDATTSAGGPSTVLSCAVQLGSYQLVLPYPCRAPFL